MSRKRKQKKQKRDKKGGIRRNVNAVVASEFPGCVAEFCGGVEQSRMAARGPTFGFRVKHAQSGKFRSNVIWLNPDYDGDFCSAWIRKAMADSNN
jgi:hypothetical protein